MKSSSRTRSSKRFKKGDYSIFEDDSTDNENSSESDNIQNSLNQKIIQSNKINSSLLFNINIIR
jgi:hypothetical protein